MENRSAILLPTLLRLGPINVATVALYRMAIRSRMAERRMSAGSGYGGPFFKDLQVRQSKSPAMASAAATLIQAQELMEGYLRYFSHMKVQLGSPPDWFLNPIDEWRIADPGRHWSSYGDFDSGAGDIKAIWEASRFDWTILLARACRLSGDQRFLITLNAWVSDWTQRNPLNCGPNWKCGQEASIRVLQMLLAAFLLNQHREPLPPLIRFVAEHCQRIRPTIRYAMAQDNNHGTSEAAALFIAGAWLTSVGGKPGVALQGERWRQAGRRWLENRLTRLVAEDGSFSQYSLNYHRLLVDTLNIVEFWRRTLAQEKFSEDFYRKARAAVEWLHQMTDPFSGDGPNLGANDGARLFALSSGSYRDYRPSVQLGSVLFMGGRAYPSGPWDEPLSWLGLSDEGVEADLRLCRQSRLFPDGGYVLLLPDNEEAGQTWGMVRCPNFRFRPGHADALHLDLWHAGANILRDSGSFSYNTGEPWQGYFSSTRAHNTVQFDGRDQMPRLGRFLQGAWLRMSHVSAVQRINGRLRWTGAYRDYQGCRHCRTVIAEGRRWQITDEIEGYRSNAVLRWRLLPGEWQMQGARCIGDLAEIEVTCDKTLAGYVLTSGWESTHYLEKSQVPVLEAYIDSSPAILTTEVLLKGI